MRSSLRQACSSVLLLILMGCALSTYKVQDEGLRPIVERYEGAEVCCALRMGIEETNAFHKTRELRADPMGEIPIGTRVTVENVISKPQGKWERFFWFVVKPEGHEGWQYIVPVGASVENLFQPCEGALGHLAAGDALFREGKLDEAAAEYKQVEAEESRYNAAAAHALGEIYRTQGALEDAVRELERAAKIDPFDPDLRGSLVTVYAELGWEEMAQEEQRAQVAAYTALAQEFLRRGRGQDAERASERAISLDRQGVAGPFITLGRAYLQQGRRDEAVEVLGRALEASPGNPHARLSLAAAYEYNPGGVRYGSGMDVERALKEYEGLLADNPLFVDAHWNLGRLYLSIGRLEDALHSLGRAVRLDPGLAQAHYELATAFFELGEYPSAWREARIAELLIGGGDLLIRKLAEVSKEPPECGRFAEMYRHYVLGFRASRLKQAGQAREEFMRAVSVGPPFAPVHTALALEYAKQGGLDVAEAELERAVAIDPSDAEACATLGALYYDTGRIEEAAGLLERAAALDSLVPGTHKYLSLIYEARGRKEDAEREEAEYRRLTGQ